MFWDYNRQLESLILEMGKTVNQIQDQVSRIFMNRKFENFFGTKFVNRDEKNVNIDK